MDNSTLLQSADPPVFTMQTGSGFPNLLLICEHGGNAVPASLNGMGLEPDDLKKHFALDIGTRQLTETIASTLDAQAILANYSRLVVDLNRFPDAPSLFVTMCDNIPIPDNQNLTQEMQADRLKIFYDPFHNRIQDWLDERITSKQNPVIVTLHSYTPVLNGSPRPQEICVVSDTDRRLATPAIDHFRKAGYNVGDNTPFDGRKGISATFNRHGEHRQIPYLMIEFRNDLLQDQKQFEDLAGETAMALQTLLTLKF
jgi:predicted N-formylglutamate amidohydrolase